MQIHYEQSFTVKYTGINTFIGTDGPIFTRQITSIKGQGVFIKLTTPEPCDDVIWCHGFPRRPFFVTPYFAILHAQLIASAGVASLLSFGFRKISIERGKHRAF